MTYSESITLTGSEWNNLDENKKLEVLQSIENHIAFESGRIACLVEAKFLHTGTDGVVLGTYDPSSRRIYINSSQFDAESMYGKNSETLVTTCLHEGRHTYQHQVADGIVQHDNPAETEIWRENLKDGNYISYRENPRAYYNQPVEVDARTFAESRYKELVRERAEISRENLNDYVKSKNAFESQMHLQSNNEGIAADYKENVSKSSTIEMADSENEGIHI